MSRTRILRNVALSAALALPLAAAAAGGTATAAAPSPAAQRSSLEASTVWGSTPRVPWVVDGQLRDGEQRVQLGLESVYRVERTAGGWLVGGAEQRNTSAMNYLVKPDGRRIALGSRPASIPAVVSEDGRRVAQVTGVRERQKVTLHRQLDGKAVAARLFRSPRVLAVRGNRVLLSILSRPAQRTLWWNADTDSTRRVIDRPALSADLSARRLVLADRRGGPCDQTLVRLAKPRSVVAELGNLTATGWNATDDAMLLDDCYFDEPFSRLAVVKTDPGYRTLARVDSEDRGGDRFSRAVWESRTTWLRLRFDDERAFVERCNKQATRCERASRRWPAQVDPIDGALLSPQVVLGTRF